MLGLENVEAIIRRMLAEEQAKDKETLRKELSRMEDRLINREQVKVLDEQISNVDRHVDDRVDFEVEERVFGI
ncbi:hypothetical protein VSDG_10186 [Cytospora chrysosperma]|uniref:Uncharacterized protein n=1 Tax=Cytospora chrysosperma TaxID=252740 RepID=A0A423V8C0_CYTCH|nr:hypothetical protein VSDG_10186 [Valsa sordida]